MSAAAPDRGLEDVERAADEDGLLPESLDLFLRGVVRFPLLTRDEEVALAKRIERGDAAAQAALINANLRLVISIAKRYQNAGVPLVDLIQEGCLGLIRAAEKFDHRLGNKFSTYATTWIRQSCQRALWKHGSVVSLPLPLHERRAALRTLSSELTAELGREATADEIAHRAGLRSMEVREALRASQSVDSLNRPAYRDGEEELVELLPDQASLDPLEQAESSRRTKAAREVLESLPEVERRIVELRFGLLGHEPLPLREVARRVGLSRERTRLLELDGLAKLRSRLPYALGPTAG